MAFINKTDSEYLWSRPRRARLSPVALFLQFRA